MPRHIQLKNGTSVTIEDRPFASGGEGDLFRITYPFSFSQLVLKIYKSDKQTRERKEKIEYLASHPPALDLHGTHHAVIWIHQAAFEKDKFVGFTMPLAKGQKLEFLCHTRLPAKLQPEWLKFDFNNSKSLNLRLKICFNIAVAIYQIHSFGSYVLVDLKPENIMIQPNGLISVIDIDSVEVMAGSGVKFAAPVSTPEYSPPEYYKGIKPEKGEVTEIWDRFSMAVIFYRLLCGIHPFTGSCKPPFDKCNGIPEMIENGLFPFGSKSSYFAIIPPPHQNFRRLPNEVRLLFIKCFNEGFNVPAFRPSAEDWCKVLEPRRPLAGNRLLPSSQALFPDFNYSRPFSPFTDLSLKVPQDFYFLEMKDILPLELIINLLIGKSKKQELKEKIELQQGRVKTLLNKKRQWDKAIKDMKDELEAERKDILVQERNNIDTLQSKFTLQLENLDRVARSLHEKEVKELQKLKENTGTGIANLEKEITSLESKIKIQEKNFQHQRSALKDLLTVYQKGNTFFSGNTASNREKELLELQTTLQKQFIETVQKIHHSIEAKQAALFKLKQEPAHISEAQKTIVKEKYNKLFQNLYTKAKNLEKLQSDKISAVSKQTEKSLKNKTKSSSPQFLKFKTELTSFQNELTREISVLTKIQMDFMKM